MLIACNDRVSLLKSRREIVIKNEEEASGIDAKNSRWD